MPETGNLTQNKPNKTYTTAHNSQTSEKSLFIRAISYLSEKKDFINSRFLNQNYKG